jgi:adenylate kinase family enzyme
LHILIEGFDGTGKSTLADMLSVTTGWPVVHQSPYRPDTEDDFRAARRKAMATATCYRDLISDRWPDVTDYCYRSLRQAGDLESVIAVLLAAKVDQIIHCDVDDIRDLRIVARPGDLIDAEQTNRILPLAARVLNTYRVLMNRLRAAGFNVHRYVALAHNTDRIEGIT